MTGRRGGSVEANARTLFVPAADGLSLAASQFGDDGAPAVIMGHGGGQSRHVWAETAERLAVAGYKVITLDSRGHGDSDWAVPPSYEPNDFARDFSAAVAWRKNLDGRGPHFVGASASGIAGLIAAGLLNPEAFASLTLVDVTPTYRPDALDKARSLFLETAEDGFPNEAEAARAVGAEPGSDRLRHLLRPGADGRWRWRWDPAFAARIHHDDRTQGQCTDAARALTIPVHLIRAGRSDFVDDETTEAFRELAPHLTVTFLPGARHVVTGDPDGIYAEAILNFLEQSAR